MIFQDPMASLDPCYTVGYQLMETLKVLSGGISQRIMIAMAIACNPGLLIADEPITALDVTIQAQIMDLLSEVQKQSGMGLILITHDLAVVSQSCEDILVMYAGQHVHLAGELPSPLNPPKGCPFNTRCPRKQTICTTDNPQLTDNEGHLTACHFPGSD